MCFAFGVAVLYIFVNLKVLGVRGVEVVGDGWEPGLASRKVDIDEGAPDRWGFPG